MNFMFFIGLFLRKLAYGLGYDIVSDDYKVVYLSYRHTNNESMSDTYASLYSEREGHWETLGISPYDHSLTDRASEVFCL